MSLLQATRALSEREPCRAENDHRSLVRFWRQRHLRIIAAHEREWLDTGLTQALIGAKNYIAHSDRTWNQSESDNR
jgi:hypothetical protein